MEGINEEVEVKVDASFTPAVVSDVAPATQRTNHQSPKLAVILKSSPARPTFQSPVITAPFTSAQKRPRTGAGNKQTLAEMPEAVAVINETPGDGRPRKRGRPKGWKPGMSYREYRGDPPPPESGGSSSRNPTKKTTASASGTPVEAKKRGRPGRPAKVSNMPARDLYLKSKPSYMTFLCEWQNPAPYGCCPAELQNMETLRKHVYLIHSRPDPLVCQWGKCAKQEAQKQYANEKTFLAHIEREHLVPYQWHMGDGFQNRGHQVPKEEPDELPSYLFDEHGNQVTPSVKDQEFETAAGMAERRRQLRRIRRLAEENAPTEQEYLRQILGADEPHF